MFFPFFSRLRLRMCILLRRCSVWHVLSIGTLLLGVAVLMLSKFLADWAWPDSRITQLLQRGEVALAQGNLSAPDGSGARASCLRPRKHWIVIAMRLRTVCCVPDRLR